MWLLSYKNTVVAISSRMSRVCVPLVLIWVVLASMLPSATPLEAYRQICAALYTNKTARTKKMTPGPATRANWDANMINVEVIIVNFSQNLKLSTCLGWFKK